MSESYDEHITRFSELPTIPGTIPGDGRDFWYVEADVDRNFGAQFLDLMKTKTSTQPNDGGMIHLDCLITTPNNFSFMSVTFNRDLEGWRSRVREACAVQGLQLAEIKGDEFILSNGDKYSIGECDIKFYIEGKNKNSKPQFNENFVVRDGKVFKVE